MLDVGRRSVRGGRYFFSEEVLQGICVCRGAIARNLGLRNSGFEELRKLIAVGGVLFRTKRAWVTQIRPVVERICLICEPGSKGKVRNSQACVFQGRPRGEGWQSVRRNVG